jgi:hypothetical protein
MSSRTSTEQERHDEDGWQDWPPSAEIALQMVPINVIVGRHGELGNCVIARRGRYWSPRT